MKAERIKRFLPYAACLLLIALLWAVAGGRTRTFDNLQDSRLVFSQGLERTGEDYGILNEGPALTLQPGEYTLRWQIETDADNAILVTTTNGADISPREIDVPAGQSEGTVVLRALDEVYNLQLLIDYRQGSFLRVNRIDLTIPAAADRVFTLTFALLAAACVAFYWGCGKLNTRTCAELALLMAAVLIASIPNFRANLTSGDDMTFHLDRLYEMISALRAGQFPARIGGHMQNHYGAVTSAFYPELFLYVPAGMILLGASRNYAIHALFTLMNLASAMSMRYAASRLFKSRNAGVISALLYTLAAYRLGDLYARFAVGEALAMCVLPLFILGLWEVLFGDARRWRLLAFSAAAIAQSHMISTAVCAVFAAALCVGCIARIVKERRFVPLVKALAVAALLNLFTIAPLATYLRQGVSTSMMQRTLAEHLLTPAQLLFGASPTRLLALGLPLVLAAIAAAGVAATRKGQEGSKPALLLLIAGVVFSLMATTLCPWEKLTDWTRGAVEYIQFPWRLLAFATCCLSFAGGHALARICGRRETLMRVGVWALCTAAFLPPLLLWAQSEDYLAANRPKPWDRVYADYTLAGTVVSQMKDARVLLSGDVTLSDYEKQGTRISANVHAQAGGEVAFPLFAFEGYAAELNGERIAVARGENNRIALSIPAGTDGALRVWFEGKPFWRVAEVISLLTACLTIASAVYGRGKQRADAVALDEAHSL